MQEGMNLNLLSKVSAIHLFAILHNLRFLEVRLNLLKTFFWKKVDNIYIFLLAKVQFKLGNLWLLLIRC